MFKLLGKIFASDAALKSGIETIRDAGDAMFYTEEEKARHQAETQKRADQLIVDWIESSKSQNISRRFLAMLVGAIWAFLLLFSWVSEQLAVWQVEDAEKLGTMTAINQPYLELVTGAMMLILSFYFAAPYAKDIVKVAMEKFGKTPKQE